MYSRITAKRLFFVFLLLLFTLSFNQDLVSENENKIFAPASPMLEKKAPTNSYFNVDRVVDGDTIVLDSGDKVRYIGIDSPETSRGGECFSENSKIINEELVLGKEVRLEKDISEKDKYGRLLRYVWVKEQEIEKEIFVNQVLVERGFASAVTYPPDVKYQELFKSAQQEAQKEKRGLWGMCLK